MQALDNSILALLIALALMIIGPGIEAAAPAVYPSTNDGGSSRTFARPRPIPPPEGLPSTAVEPPRTFVVQLSGNENPAFPPPQAQGFLLRVASVQMNAFTDGPRTAAKETEDRAAKMVDYIARAAAYGALIVVFPEMTLTRYDAALIRNLTQATVTAAEATVAAAAKAHGVWVIFGAPKFLLDAGSIPANASTCGANQPWHNTALVVNPEGKKVYRQAKLRCGGPDGVLGSWLNTFNMAGAGWNLTASLQICASAGDPNVARLPALAGAQLLFDISQESDITHEYKMAGYAAQYVARAHENRVFVVQANAGEALVKKGPPSYAGVLNPQGGSHGNSLVIGPLGDVLVKSPMFGEFVAVADLDLARLRGGGPCTVDAAGKLACPREVAYAPHAFMAPFYVAGLRSLRSMPID